MMERKAIILVIALICCDIASAYHHDSYGRRGYNGRNAARDIANDMNDQLATEESGNTKSKALFIIVNHKTIIKIIIYYNNYYINNYYSIIVTYNYYFMRYNYCKNYRKD